ncbi:hypothetical protein [Singulisphaera sp. PoT]|uniref:hypothetical protein n=1 Tax=Singulisphaera sp. PoT TaxID=3411797 RepID=UPI003BF57CFB
MLLETSDHEPTLSERVESRIRESTYGRIRNLSVEEVAGRLVVRGRAPSHHTRQLALHGVLQLLSGDRLHEKIVVG